MKLADKKKIVEELHEQFSKATVVVVTDHKGLNVATINQLRWKLREAGAKYTVVKNSLLARAAHDTNVAIIADIFTGPSAIAISDDDPTTVAKILIEFAKNNEALTIRVGVMGDKSLTLEQIKTLSELPSREVLLGELLSVMNGVPAAFVRTLNAIPAHFLNLLTALKYQKSSL